MKPELENIGIEATKRSFHFFKRENEPFAPFWHYHPELELTLIVNGEGTRFVGDSIEPFGKLDLVLIGENVPHHWVSFSDTRDSTQEAIVFQFRADVFASFKECSSFLGLFELAKRGIHFTQPSDEIIDLIESFVDGDEIQQLGVLMQLINALECDEHKSLLATEAYVDRQKQKGNVQKFARVNNYILEHLTQKLTIEKMADLTNMVPQSFCRWFKKHAGHSFVTFLNKAKVQHACQLLTNSDISIQEVAFSSGFESLSHFNRTFRKHKQLSPREFKSLC